MLRTMNSKPLTIGAIALQRWLDENTTTIVAFAVKAKVAPRSVQHWKAGRCKPNAAAAAKLEKATGGEVRAAMWGWDSGEAVRRG